jgi:hypothetical protein
LSREAASIIEGEVLHAAAAAQVPVDEVSCPLMPQRGRFHAQEQAKEEVRHSSWRCSWCGKSFRSQTFIDWHMQRQHAANDTGSAEATVGAAAAAFRGVSADAGTNIGDGGTCLADYCGMLGCPSLPLDTLPEAAALAAEAFQEEQNAEEQEGDGAESQNGSDGGNAAGPSAATVASTAPTPISHLRAGWTNLAGRHTHDAVRPIKPGAHTRLTRTQQRERDRCIDVLASCFPLPATAVAGAGAGALLDSATAAAVAAAVAAPAGGSADVDVVAAANAGGSNADGVGGPTYLRVPATAAPMPLLNRTLALRQQLAAEFCDPPLDAKVAKRKQPDGVSATAVVMYTFGGTAALMGVLYALIIYCADEDGVLTGVEGRRAPTRRKMGGVGRVVAAELAGGRRASLDDGGAYQNHRLRGAAGSQPLRRRHAGGSGGGGGGYAWPDVIPGRGGHTESLANVLSLETERASTSSSEEDERVPSPRLSGWHAGGSRGSSSGVPGGRSGGDIARGDGRHSSTSRPSAHPSRGPSPDSLAWLQRQQRETGAAGVAAPSSRHNDVGSRVARDRFQRGGGGSVARYGASDHAGGDDRGALARLLAENDHDDPLARVDADATMASAPSAHRARR